MSRHNYSQYSNNKKQHEYVQPVVDAEPVIADVEAPAVEVKMESVAPIVEAVETVTLPTVVKGAVANCSRLNVREEPRADAAVATIINSSDEVEINVDESDNEWLRVRTANGINGYCMRKYVNARL